MARVVGIDLGTTNSAIAAFRGGNAEIIVNAEGKRTTPSIVAFTKNGELLVGEPAKRQMVLNSERTIKSIKRKMGSNYTVNIDGKSYTPPQISAFVLQKLKKDAEAYLNDTVTKAVITVPAYFEDPQRQATKDAGKIAGLEVLRIINEPTAAALAYGVDKKGSERIVVYDLGGGTFDISVLDIGDGVIQVVSTAGNNHLGGDDFDRRIVEWMCDEFKKMHGIDLHNDKQAMQRLLEAAEIAKMDLSSKLETEINLPYITADANGTKHLELKLTRSKFEQLNQDLLDSTIPLVQRALDDAKMKSSDVDEILLVGGSTRIPYVQKLIKDYFGKEPNKSVNPDEVVAIGASIQASIIEGEIDKDVVLVDVTPLSLGVEVQGGLFEKIIEKNTTIPTRKSKIFTTGADYQTNVEIHVLQGERQLAKDNRSLGRFNLMGIPPAPRGVPRIEVSFDIDTDGIVHVSAKEESTGKEQSIKITGTTNLSQDEIEKMVRESQQFEEQDRRKRQEIELKNNADNLAYQVDKFVKEQGDKIPADKKTVLENKVKDLRNAIEKDDINSIKMIMDELQKEFQATGSQMYQQAAQTAGATDQQATQQQNPQQDQSGPAEGDYIPPQQ
jgi:molecular chaperone DnaK